MDTRTADQILTQLEESYDTIAEHFSHTRMNQWYEVSYIIEQYIEPGQAVLDLGCGNGRVADLVNEIKARYIGMDVSEKLINVARQLRPKNDFRVGNMMQTDFPDESFDHVLMIASFHHIPSKEYRRRSLEEAKRLVRSRGFVLMTNWNLMQTKYASLRYRSKLMKLLGQHKMDFNDMLVPWRDNKRRTITKRYYHAFKPSEIKHLAKEVGLTVADQYYETNGLHVPRYKAHNLVSVLLKP